MYIFSKSRAEELARKARQFKYRSQTNYPHLSGDSFAQISDYVFPPTKQNIKKNNIQISNAEVIFCKSDFLEELLADNFNSISAKVLLVGNGDIDFKNEIYRFPRSTKAIFMQNSFISDNKRIWTLPIGLENLRLGRNGLASNFQLDIAIGNRRNQILIGPFGATHDERNFLNELPERSECWSILHNRIEPHDYVKNLSNYKWVACPRGNGIDTHRVWETMYVGGFPILLEDAWSKSLNWLDLPIMQLSEWSEESLLSLLNRKTTLEEPRNLLPLWMPFWENFIRSKF